MGLYPTAVGRMTTEPAGPSAPARVPDAAAFQEMLTSTTAILEEKVAWLEHRLQPYVRAEPEEIKQPPQGIDHAWAPYFADCRVQINVLQALRVRLQRLIDGLEL